MSTAMKAYSSQIGTFSILNHLGQLEVVEDTSTEYHCICPICGDDNLKINKASGAYQCWSNQCKCREIRQAIAPLPSRNQIGSPRLHSRKPIRRVKRHTWPVASALTLAKLAQLATDSPTPQVRPDYQHGEVVVTRYQYSSTQWVDRIEWRDSTKCKGRDKKFVQWHQGDDRKPIAKKGNQPWPPYRLNEAVEAIAASQATALLVAEGEKAVEAYREIGYACITLQGGGWSDADLDGLAQQFKELAVTLVFHPDYDAAGTCKAQKFQGACDRVGVPCLVLDPLVIDPEVPGAGDVVDILERLRPDELIQGLERAIDQAIAAQQQNSEFNDELTNISESRPDAELVFTQIAFEALYRCEPWICTNGVLHQWTGAYYKAVPDDLETKRITAFCNNYPVESKTGGSSRWSYKYATPGWVEKVLKWAKQSLGVDPQQVNPPGLNCTNGILQIRWEGTIPTWQLVPHMPQLIYTYQPQVTYEPNADPTYCDRMLEALDAPQRDVLLKTLAASLDLQTVRRYKGRMLRALLLKGDGSNGKDTLREAVAMLYGFQGLTGCTFSDFKQYDQGRKFALAKLAHSRVNWASENRECVALDKLQSLKTAITSDPIDIEHKGRDEYSINPNAVFLFNVNDTPDMQASLEAIQSRYGILTFNKTFKVGADIDQGEIEADPRFKYDPEFLRQQVLSAFLNYLLFALVQLMQEGINYDCTKLALEAVQCESCHLWQFVKDTGLHYDAKGKLYVNEIWKCLEAWYIANGTLEIEVNDKGKKKTFWHDQARQGDRNVKASNQVIERFRSLFPKVSRNRDEKGTYLVGLSFASSPHLVTDAIASEAEAVTEARMLAL